MSGAAQHRSQQSVVVLALLAVSLSATSAFAWAPSHLAPIVRLSNLPPNDGACMSRRRPRTVATMATTSGINEQTVTNLWMTTTRSLLRLGANGVKDSHVRSLSDLVQQHNVVKVKLSDSKMDAAAAAEELGGAAQATLIDIHESGRYLLFGNDDFVATLTRGGSGMEEVVDYFAGMDGEVDEGIEEVLAGVSSEETEGFAAVAAQAQAEVDAMIDMNIGSDEDPFGGVPRAKGDW